jgi:hypothetical protein
VYSSSRGVRPPEAVVPVPGAKTGSAESISSESAVAACDVGSRADSAMP